MTEISEDPQNQTEIEEQNSDFSGDEKKRKMYVGLDLGTLQSCILTKLSKPGTGEHHGVVVPTVVGSLVGGNNEVGTIQSLTPSIDVIEIGAYNLLMEAYRSGVKRVGSVLLGGGVGGIRKELALKAMLAGYGKAYDEIYEFICDKN